MIERTPGLPEGVVGLRAKREPIRILFHFPEGFHRFTAGAAWEDTKLGLRNLRLIRRCAVVTDIKWLRASSQAMAMVVPTRMRVFGENGMDEAIACDHHRPLGGIWLVYPRTRFLSAKVRAFADFMVAAFA